jgi:hypothetical protein
MKVQISKCCHDNTSSSVWSKYFTSIGAWRITIDVQASCMLLFVHSNLIHHRVSYSPVSLIGGERRLWRHWTFSLPPSAHSRNIARRLVQCVMSLEGLALTPQRRTPASHWGGSGLWGGEIGGGRYGGKDKGMSQRRPFVSADECTAEEG